MAIVVGCLVLFFALAAFPLLRWLVGRALLFLLYWLFFLWLFSGPDAVTAATFFAFCGAFLTLRWFSLLRLHGRPFLVLSAEVLVGILVACAVAFHFENVARAAGQLHDPSFLHGPAKLISMVTGAIAFFAVRFLRILIAQIFRRRLRRPEQATAFRIRT